MAPLTQNTINDGACKGACKGGGTTDQPTDKPIDMLMTRRAKNRHMAKNRTTGIDGCHNIGSHMAPLTSVRESHTDSKQNKKLLCNVA